MQENIVSETSAKLEATYKINKTLELLNGYHFVETKITNLDDVDNPLLKQLISEVVRTHGAYSQISYQGLNKKTNFNFGLRYNYIGKFNKYLVEPRLTFSQRFLDNFSIEFLGEFKHQNTSQIINFQNDFLGIEKRRWQLSNNKDIPIIQSKQASLGVNYSKKGWLFSVEGYYKFVKGITTQSQGFQNQFEFLRTNGSYLAYGMDIIFRKQIKNYNAWLSYSFVESDYEFETLPEQTFANHFAITHSIAFGLAYTTRRFKISSGLNWNSGRPTTKPNQNNPVMNGMVNYNAANSNVFKDYFRVDASALYNFSLINNIKANLGVSVWNVLDRANQINSFYSVIDDYAFETTQNSLGITPNVVFRVCF